MKFSEIKDSQAHSEFQPIKNVERSSCIRFMNKNENDTSLCLITLRRPTKNRNFTKIITATISNQVGKLQFLREPLVPFRKNFQFLLLWNLKKYFPLRCIYDFSCFNFPHFSTPNMGGGGALFRLLVHDIILSWCIFFHPLGHNSGVAGDFRCTTTGKGVEFLTLFFCCCFGIAATAECFVKVKEKWTRIVYHGVFAWGTSLQYFFCGYFTLNEN